MKKNTKLKWWEVIMGCFLFLGLGTVAAIILMLWIKWVVSPIFEFINI